MSSMINRLRTLWIGGDDMAGFKYLGSLVTSTSLDIPNNASELILIVSNNNSYASSSGGDLTVWGIELIRVNSSYGIQTEYSNSNYPYGILHHFIKLENLGIMSAKRMGNTFQQYDIIKGNLSGNSLIFEGSSQVTYQVYYR